MNKVLKLQRIGLMTPTAVEYKGKILATNQLDIESTCNLWRNHFGFYPTERIDLAMTEKDFSVIQQKPLASSKSVYELFCEQTFIPRVFEITEKFAEWGIYRNNEVDALKTENAALRERLEKSVELPFKLGNRVWFFHYDEETELPDEVVSSIFIGGNKKYAFLSPRVYAGKLITKPNALCQYYFGEYKKFEDECDCDVIPYSECFKTREEAEVRLAELNR